jgi:hypothetical protein
LGTGNSYEQSHGIGWHTINARISHFRKNIRNGYPTTLVFDASKGQLSLYCGSKDGYAGSDVVTQLSKARQWNV